MPPAEQKCQGQQQGLRQHQQSPTNGNNVGIIDEDMMAIIAARSQEAAQRETTDQDWKRKQEAALVAAASRMVRLPPFSRPSADADADADADATSVGLHQRPRIVPLVGGGGDIEEGSNDTARTIGQFSTEPPINEQAQQQQEQSEAAPVAQLGESSEPISPTQLPQTVDETFDSAPEEGEEAVQTRDTGQDDEEEENHSINYEDLTDQPLVEAVLVLQEADDETEHENAYSSTDSTSRNDTTITSAAPLSTDLTSATSTGFMTPETELTVVEAKPIDQGRKTFLSRKVICLVMGLLFTAIAALSIGFAVSAKNNEGNSSSDSESNENVASKGDDNAVISPGSTNNPLAEDGDFIIPSTNRMPVLQRLARGEKLRCGVINGPGLFFYNEDGTAGGFDASLVGSVPWCCFMHLSHSVQRLQGLLTVVRS